MARLRTILAALALLAFAATVAAPVHAAADTPSAAARLSLEGPAAIASTDPCPAWAFTPCEAKVLPSPAVPLAAPTHTPSRLPIRVAHRPRDLWPEVEPDPPRV